MKRYSVFVCDVYYPSGGMYDFDSDHYELEDAKAVYDEKVKNDWQHVHVWDNITMKELEL